MKKARTLTAVAAVLLCAALAMGQTNARTMALGNHNVGGKNLIEDPSDVFYFPSDIGVNANMVQGVSGVAASAPGYVFASKSILDNLVVGLLFGKSTALDVTGFDIAMNNAYGDLGAFAWSTGAKTGTDYGADEYALGSPTIPEFAGHLLFGIKLGEMLYVGADVFREASNSSTDIKNSVTMLPGTPGAYVATTSNVGFSDYSAKGLNAGVGLKLSMLKLKLTTGYTIMSQEGEMTNKETNGAPVNTTTNIEVSKFETKSGYYLPLFAKADVIAGNHNFYAGLNFEKSGASFGATFDDGDAGTVTNAAYKSAEYSMQKLGLGIGDQYKLTENTSVYLSLIAERNSTTTKPTTVDLDNPEQTTTTVILPRTCLGIEHTINGFWKFDKVIARAGGHKTYSWDNDLEEGGATLNDISNEPNFEPFSWYTGVAFVYGNLDLALVMAPSEWNGVYLLSAEGPSGISTQVTLTYKFGASSTQE